MSTLLGWSTRVATFVVGRELDEARSDSCRRSSGGRNTTGPGGRRTGLRRSVGLMVSLSSAFETMEGWWWWRFSVRFASMNAPIGCRAETGLYRKKSSGCSVTGEFLLRRKKNQTKTTRAMITMAPPIAPPTMAPKWDVVEELVGAVVEDGVLVDKVELVEVGEGEAVVRSTDGVGELVAKAPWPVSTGVGFI